MLVYFSCVICDQYQGQKYPQEQRLKEMSKFNFQIRNKTRIYDSKIKNIIIKNKNMRCVKPMWKRNFIMLKYVNMNMKRTWQGYGIKLCLRLMLNKLKELKGLTSNYTPLGTYFKEVSMCASSKEVS